MSNTEQYVVYNRETIKTLAAKNGNRYFKTPGLAKRTLTNASKKKNFDPTKWKVGTVQEWKDADYEIEVVAVVGGAKVKIMKSTEGECTDPSTERYWSM